MEGEISALAETFRPASEKPTPIPNTLPPQKGAQVAQAA
jgi:hypothetical protein